MAGHVAMLHAAPLPTNVTSMKSMVADNSIQIRWGGWRGGGWGYRGFGGWGPRGWGWGAGALAGAVIGGAIAAAHMAIMAARTTAATTPARITAATIPPTATLRHTSTTVGKRSRNLGPPASTDLTDTAGLPGAIGKRAGFARIQHSPSTFGVLIIVLQAVDLICFLPLELRLKIEIRS
jgi:hypothetical protein